MFAGIVGHVGRVERVDGARAVISGLGPVRPGRHLCCSGVWLTVVAAHPDGFEVALSSETIARTSDRLRTPGAPVNIEAPLRIGDEFGGHLVRGHVDGPGLVLDVVPVPGHLVVRIALPPEIAEAAAPGQAISIDGASITIQDVVRRDDATEIAVHLSDHTASRTTLGGIAAGDRVNIEIDTLARYAMRRDRVLDRSGK